MKRGVNHSNEKVLIAALISGDRDAFSQVLNTHRDSVIRICRGFVHSREDAEDIAQEVFVKLAAKLKTFGQKSAFKTWIYRITINTAKDFIR
ncbi:MAG: RNA polymerase sigma factor, partial [Bacteroidales bacterium]|nr:RNA polymerase sigma factor [Bacteroidales bacterium]